MSTVLILLLALLAVLFAGLSVPQAWRAWWWELEDPRRLGQLRAAFCVVCILDLVALSPHLEFLFTDRGLLGVPDVCRRFTGGLECGDDWSAIQIVQFLRGGCASPLLVWRSPTVAWCLYSALLALLGAYTIGVFRWVPGVLALVLLHFLSCANTLYWHSTELVFRIVLFWLVVSGSHRGFSVRKRRRGVSRCVVFAFGRRMIALQICFVYVVGALRKSGTTWHNGAAVYDVLLNDHLARFDWAPLLVHVPGWALTAITWATIAFEAGVWLLYFGSVRRSTAVRAALAGAPRGASYLFATLAVVLASVGLWHTPGAGRLATIMLLSWCAIAAAALAFPALGWVTSPRAWMSGMVCFQVVLWTTLDISMFQPLMLVLCIAFLDPRRNALSGESVAGLAHESQGTRSATRFREWLAARGRLISVCSMFAAVMAAFFVGSPYAAACLVAAGALWVGAGNARGWHVLSSKDVLAAWHIFACGAWMSTGFSEPGAVGRASVRDVTGWWLGPTFSRQQWAMFAPDAARDNVFTRVYVEHGGGATAALAVDIDMNPRGSGPGPLWTRNVDRRIRGGGFGNARWVWAALGEYHCRMSTPPPVRVVVTEVAYAIPSPERLRTLRPGYRQDLIANGRETPKTIVECQPAPLLHLEPPQ